MSPWVIFIWALPPKGGRAFRCNSSALRLCGISAAIPNAHLFRAFFQIIPFFILIAPAKI